MNISPLSRRAYLGLVCILVMASCDGPSFSRKNPEGKYKLKEISFSVCDGFFEGEGLKIPYRVDPGEIGTSIVLARQVDLVDKQGRLSLLAGKQEPTYMPVIDTGSSTALTFVDPARQLPIGAVKTNECH